jgi:hypothetical protein
LFNKDKTELYSYVSASGNVTIPSGVTWIFNGAFAGCRNLIGITIPSNVTLIGDQAFYACSNLTNITVTDDNPSYSSESGILFNKDKTELCIYPSGMGGNVIIPSSVTSIGDCAFDACVNLKSVTIPQGVTSIGFKAFGECLSIISITIPASVTDIDGLVFSFWTSSQTINVEGYANQQAADAAWGKSWRMETDYSGGERNIAAKINYNGQ